MRALLTYLYFSAARAADIRGAPMDELRQAEYAALRATIKERGTARVVLFPVMVGAWAVMMLLTLAVSPRPLSFLFPLMALAATFEAVFHLHTGVERIGRYLQVFYEKDVDPTRGQGWETIAMAYGRAFPGSGSDPLFVTAFAVAIALNLVPTLLMRPNVAWAIVAVAHVALLVRISLARRRAAGQRALDLERFRTLLNREPGAASPPSA
jgi:hypothetical protein